MRSMLDNNIFVITSLAAGLSAACGFRVFLPPLSLGVAASYGILPLSANYEWLSRPETLAVLGCAAIIELIAFYIPVLDHLLDLVAVPAATIAGGILTCALLDGTAPVLQWSLVLIAGAAPASLTQVSTSVLRAASTATTGGLGNFIVATLELLGATAVIALALFAPMLCLGLVIGLTAAFFFGAKKIINLWRARGGKVASAL